MTDNYRGVTYSYSHVYKVLRKGNVKGGGSKVSADEFDDSVLGSIFTTYVIKYHNLLPVDDQPLIIEDKLMPDALFQMSKEIQRFLNRHGPFSPLSIGLMNVIIDMDRMGITNSKTYFKLMMLLDTNPPKNFKDYIRKLIEFEKELK